MPENIKGLSKLKFLDISNCRRLQLLPELPMGVGVMADDCSSLQSISDPLFLLLPHWRRRKTSFIHCFKLDLSKILHEESCREFCANICFPGDEIPKWFTFQNTGSYITLDQSLDWHNKNFLGFLASIVVSPGFYCGIHFYVVTCYCSVKSEDGEEQIYITEHESIGVNKSSTGRTWSDHVLFSFHSITEFVFKEHKYYHDRICYEMTMPSNCKVLIKFNAYEAEVKKCGIKFLYVEDYGEPLEISRRSVDNAKKKGKEKAKDDLQTNKLQISNPFDGICKLRSSATSLDLNEMVGSAVIDTTESHPKRLKICDYKNKYEDEKEVEELNPSTSQPTGFALLDLNEFPMDDDDDDDDDEPQPKRLKEF
ncbi:hypothetical protein Patl1_26362 [Pistacia atlantica]|uniref:Uncharacterized protein n=1 Tax=Pistacia atlantica TaxID=434234 RepID=A0ACC1B439_9ROSI|nr:hypothetical protein Patl1_26362 [Pistacia atlantica]